MGGEKEIPMVGLGTWRVTDEKELIPALNAALEIGYRHIDTATSYRNEHIIGTVLKEWFTSKRLKREDIFITTKVPGTHIHPDLVESAIKESLEKLQVDYVDLYLLHFPFRLKYVDQNTPLEPLPTDHLAVWRKMEEQVDAKRARTIGLSNFNRNQIDRIVKNSRIKPSNLQVEAHIYLQEKELVNYCKQNNISVVGYSSLGSPGALEFFKKVGWTFGETVLPKILEDHVATKIAQKHKKTVAQVVLRFLTQLGIMVIPGVDFKRLKENFDILSFTLDEEDLKALESLDKGEDGRFCNMLFINPALKYHPEYPFRK